MATLYLDRKGAALDIDAGSLTVRLGGALATRIPLAPLERVVLRGEAVLSTRVLAELWRRDIGLLLLSGRHSEATARLVGGPTTTRRCAFCSTGGRSIPRPAARPPARSSPPSSPARRGCSGAPSRCGPTGASL